VVAPRDADPDSARNLGFLVARIARWRRPRAPLFRSRSTARAVGTFHARRRWQHARAENLDALPRATSDDVGGILKLLAPLEEAARWSGGDASLSSARLNTSPCRDDSVIYGCAALYPFPRAGGGMGELAALTRAHRLPGHRRRRAFVKAHRAGRPRPGTGGLFVLTNHSTLVPERGFATAGIETADRAPEPIQLAAAFRRF